MFKRVSHLPSLIFLFLFNLLPAQASVCERIISYINADSKNILEDLGQASKGEVLITASFIEKPTNPFLQTLELNKLRFFQQGKNQIVFYVNTKNIRLLSELPLDGLKELSVTPYYNPQHPPPFSAMLYQLKHKITPEAKNNLSSLTRKKDVTEVKLKLLLDGPVRDTLLPLSIAATMASADFLLRRWEENNNYYAEILVNKNNYYNITRYVLLKPQVKNIFN